MSNFTSTKLTLSKRLTQAQETMLEISNNMQKLYVHMNTKNTAIENNGKDNKPKRY